MANVVDTQTLLDGPRNVVVKVVLQGEAAGSDESGTSIVDVSALSGSPTYLSLLECQYDLTGFSAQLLWDATTDDELLSLSGASELDFRRIGGIVDPQSTGSTGDVLITTVGMTVAADMGSIILTFRKHFG